jgi:hypothetical protein
MSSHGIRVAGLAVLVAVLVGCHEPGKYNIAGPTDDDGTPVDDILRVTAAPETVPADGLSRTTITARIDSRSTTRDITFASSLGTLFAGARSSATEGGKLTIAADVAGLATVELKSEPLVGTAKVTVSVGTVTLVKDVPFVPVNADALLTLAAASPAIPADGYSVTEITAQLTTGADPRQSVKFTTSLGSLVNSVNDASARQEVSVTANAQGLARILLRSENTVGSAVVRAEVVGFSREVLVRFDPVAPGNVITLAAVPREVEADGTAVSQLVATISPDVPQRLRTVTFTTTFGDFTTDLVSAGDTKRATVTADAGNVAVVALKSSTPGTAFVTATVSGVSARASVEFTRPLPQTIHVQPEAGSVAIAGATSITVTATLFRDSGPVADPTVVTWTAIDSAGRIIGTFSEVSLATRDNATGQIRATAEFDPDSTAATGTATIRATVGSVSGTATVQLQ